MNLLKRLIKTVAIVAIGTVGCAAIGGLLAFAVYMAGAPTWVYELAGHATMIAAGLAAVMPAVADVWTVE